MRATTRNRIGIWSRLNTCATVATALTAVLAVVVTRWDWLAGSLLVIIAQQIGSRLTFAAAAVAAVLQAWPALVPAILTLLFDALARLHLWSAAQTEPLDEEALAAAVREIPPTLVRRFVPGPDGTVDTLVLLRAAMRHDPQRWPSSEDADGVAANCEGGRVLDTGWTVVAAECALVARLRPDQRTPVDVSMLAAIAAMTPHSRAQVAFARAGWNLHVVQDLLGLPVSEATAVWSRASSHSGGELIGRRARLSVQGGHPIGELLSDVQWADLTGKRGEA